MKVTVSRVKMAGFDGTAFAYDVYVKKAHVPEWQRKADPHGNSHTTILRDDDEFYSYVDATETKEHREMPQGWDRLADFETHEKKARLEMLAIIKLAFPETEYLEKYPVLWCFPPNMPAGSSHLDRELEV